MARNIESTGVSTVKTQNRSSSPGKRFYDKEEANRDTVISPIPEQHMITCWNCLGRGQDDHGHCKVCWGRGQVVWNPNDVNVSMMNPHPG